MKFKVTMKSPDAFDDAIHEALKVCTRESDEEIREICKKWFRYGEYLTVEIDTKEKTCKVVEV